MHYSLHDHNAFLPIPVTARSKTLVFGRSLAGIVGSNPAGGMDVCLLWVLLCQVEVSATGWSLVQRSPTECGVSVCDLESLNNEAA
jgi:hypothetical protein